MMRNNLAVLAICGVLGACVSAPAIRVADAEGVQAVSAIGMGCNRPFALTQDCSGMSGPTKAISVGGRRVKVAGNESGTVTVMFGGSGSNATQASNLGFDLLKRELTTRGFDIVSVTPIESAGIMFGYAIETDRPSYHIWDEFKVD